MEKFSKTEQSFSQEELERLETLDRLDLIPDKKLDLALLLLDRKRAAQLGMYQVVEGEPDKAGIEESIHQEFNRSKGAVEQLGLLYHIKHAPEERDGIFGFSILTAKSRENLNAVVEADTENNDKLFGTLMGYPETAVEGYRTADALEPGILSETDNAMLGRKELAEYLHFRLSRDNWREELAWAEENRNLIRSHCPLLYKDLGGD